ARCACPSSPPAGHALQAGLHPARLRTRQEVPLSGSSESWPQYQFPESPAGAPGCARSRRFSPRISLAMPGRTPPHTYARRPIHSAAVPVKAARPHLFHHAALAIPTHCQGAGMTHVIALVDDDRNILTSVSITLQAEGFLTRVYTDGQTALKSFADNPPDL